MSTASNEERRRASPRRSMLALPGSNQRFLEKSTTLPADGLLGNADLVLHVPADDELGRIEDVRGLELGEVRRVEQDEPALGVRLRSAGIVVARRTLVGDSVGRGRPSAMLHHARKPNRNPVEGVRAFFSFQRASPSG